MLLLLGDVSLRRGLLRVVVQTHLHLQVLRVLLELVLEVETERVALLVELREVILSEIVLIEFVVVVLEIIHHLFLRHVHSVLTPLYLLQLWHHHMIIS